MRFSLINNEGIEIKGVYVSVLLLIFATGLTILCKNMKSSKYDTHRYLNNQCCDNVQNCLQYCDAIINK